MKIIVFNGSPNAEYGNTHIMVREFLNGAKDAGAEVENIFLTKKEIKPCQGCFTCWIKTPGKCIIKDDMQELLLKFISSDIVIFATPLYIYNVTGIMKNFLDRTIPLVKPHQEIDKQGITRHPKRFKQYPKMVVISNCGFPEQSNFQALTFVFKQLARNMHTEVIAEIYRGEGQILKEPPLILKPIIWRYKKLLRKAGKEIVENLKLSHKTIAKLEEPIVSKEQYVKGANKYWNRLLSKNLT